MCSRIICTHHPRSLAHKSIMTSADGICLMPSMTDPSNLEPKDTGHRPCQRRMIDSSPHELGLNQQIRSQNLPFLWLSFSFPYLVFPYFSFICLEFACHSIFFPFHLSVTSFGFLFPPCLSILSFAFPFFFFLCLSFCITFLSKDYLSSNFHPFPFNPFPFLSFLFFLSFPFLSFCILFLSKYLVYFNFCPLIIDCKVVMGGKNRFVKTQHTSTMLEKGQQKVKMPYNVCNL